MPGRPALHPGSGETPLVAQAIARRRRLAGASLMAVVATAGHVDHGKSTLVRLLTGQEPDRWAEERRRGLTIDLGYAWTDIDGRRVSLVDVPGHEHFTGNMLAGLGPVECRDVRRRRGRRAGGRSPRSTRAAIAALRHRARAARRDPLRPRSRAPRPPTRQPPASHPWTCRSPRRCSRQAPRATVCRSCARRWAVSRHPPAAALLQPSEPARLWVDRSFTIRGAGAVVTGTLEAGTLRVDDALLLRGRRVTDPRPAVVRRAGRVPERTGSGGSEPAGLAATEVYRGDALLTESWPPPATLIDVTGDDVGARLPRELTLHVGTAALPVRSQRLKDGHVRLRLPRPIPLVAGDRAVLRDPGLRRGAGRRHGRGGRPTHSTPPSGRTDEEVGRARQRHRTAYGH